MPADDLPSGKSDEETEAPLAEAVQGENRRRFQEGVSGMAWRWLGFRREADGDGDLSAWGGWMGDSR